MITFLWMLYLAFTLMITKSVIFQLLLNYKHKQREDTFEGFLQILCYLLWSIWYFYYLH